MLFLRTKMVDKILLAKCESQGNLRSGKQSYYMYYYQKILDGDKVIKLDKAVLELVAPSSNGEDVLKSYWMLDPAATRIMLLDMIKLYFYFSFRREELNEFNHHYKIIDIQREVDKIAKEVLKGSVL